MRASVVAFFAVLGCAEACVMRYTNKASKPITMCLRANGGIPGAEVNKTLAVSESWDMPCRQSVPGQSSQSYFAVPGFTECGWDQGCDPNTGSCHHYPWVVGQGVGTNGLWYGSIGSNWDGAGIGFTGNFSEVGYGMHFECSSYNATQHVSATCKVANGQATCDPNIPNYQQPNSGVVECDPDQTLMLSLIES
eukprot:TRINITY_DN4222_c0_g1_i1.p1 TRINITY_DN4222_c0_g1~~TRINITY_DN4222_c0_g1_i1.p1  ORF type:complete len:193 (+),score=74.85 TRINITY_DN4222_c0_g1_i1:65-643(+)